MTDNICLPEKQSILIHGTITLTGFSTTIGSITFSLFQVVLCALMATKIDKAGRRLFLKVSASGMILGCIMVGSSFYGKDIEARSTLAHIVAFIGLMVYGGSYVVGVASIPNMLVAEIFPINVKGLAGSLTNLTSWICSCIVVYTFNFLNVMEFIWYIFCICWNQHGVSDIHRRIGT